MNSKAKTQEVRSASARIHQMVMKRSLSGHPVKAAGLQMAVCQWFAAVRWPDDCSEKGSEPDTR